MTGTSITDTAKAGLLATRWYAHRLEQVAFPGVLVLCYHGLRGSSRATDDIPFANLHVTEDTFEAHCRLIADTCHPIDLTAFADAQVTERALPSRPVLVTFDDGYRSVFEMARPILHRYRIPGAVFVCSEPVREQSLFSGSTPSDAQLVRRPSTRFVYFPTMSVAPRRGPARRTLPPEIRSRR